MGRRARGASTVLACAGACAFALAPPTDAALAATPATVAPPALVERARADEAAGNLAAAQAEATRALARARTRGDARTEAAATAELGVVEDDLGFADVALADDQRALALARALHDRAAAAEALGNAGIAQMHLGNLDASLALARQSLALHASLGNRRGIADETTRIGLIDELHGSYEAALAAFARALALHHAIGYVLGEAKARNNIGIVDEHLARYEEALAMHRAALPLFRAAHNRAGAAADLENIAIVDADLGRYDDALAAHREVLAAYQALGNRRGEAEDLANTAIVDEATGRYDEGLAALRDALAVDRRIHNAYGTANALGAIGAIEEDIGRDAAALQAFQSALAIHRRMGNPRGIATDYGDIGTAASELHHEDAALLAHESALEVDRSIPNVRGEADDYANVGGLFERAGRYADARTAYAKARELDASIGDRLGAAEALGNLAVAEDALGTPAAALASAREAIATETQIGAPEGLWRAHRVAAHAEGELGDPAAALRDYDAAIDTIEHERAGLERSERRSFFAKKLFVYDEYARYLFDLFAKDPNAGYDRKAFEIFERRHARTFLELVAQSAVRTFAGVPPEVVARQRELSLEDERMQDAIVKARTARHPVYREILALEREAAGVARRRATLDGEIRARYPAFAAILHPQPIVAQANDASRLDIAGFQHTVLRPGEALLVYDVLADRTAVWAVTPVALRLALVPAGSEALAASAGATRAYAEAIENEIAPGISLTKRGRDARARYPAVEAASAALYETLVPPEIRPLVADAKTLFIVPTGPLYGFPFETLVTHAAEGDARTHYLVDDAAVAYLPSASLLAVLRSGATETRARTHALLAFADPAYDAPPSRTPDAAAGVLQQREAALTSETGGFPELPGTADEARAVFAALGIAPTPDDLHTGDDASVQTLDRLNRTGELATYRYVFFGAHAVLPDEVEGVTNSTLVLAHPPGGFLTTGDVFGLNLAARAVVLSACQSGRGVVTAGEGVQGLTQAFMYAGAPVVTVTDWKVEDDVQPDFTKAFFAAMAAGETPAAALRTAKLGMLASDAPERSQPFFWASTVIFGDGDAAQ
jgi:CHAT domain-containing protein/tetratricopeptide (TPR) repeat protein